MKNLFLILVASIACACTSSKVAAPKAESVWTVEWISGVDNINVEDLEAPSIMFLDSKYSSSTGCNRLNGSLEINGNAIKFGDGPMTKVACNDNNRERMFMEALFGVDTYSINGDKMELLSNGKTVMKLVLNK